MFKKTILPNGLRILTAPMAGTNTVTVLVMCATGSDCETKEISGISHFLEHMFFQGTTSRPSSKIINQELVRMGSEHNAFTGHETTGYFIKAGKLYLARSLDILADIYKNSLLDEKEIAREKQVVVEEMHLDKDTPTTHIWRLWEGLLYGDQPAGWDISGDEKTVRRFRREDCISYFARQYVAGNTAVVVAGSIDAGKVVDEVKKLFSDIRQAEPRSKPAVREAQATPAFLAEERKTDQTHCIIGFRGYDVFHPRRYAADILATILGGSGGSRMYLRIRDELGLAYAIFSGSSNYSNRGYLYTYAGVAHDNLEKTGGAILDEYRRIREEKVPDDEIEITREFLKGRILMDLETSNAMASFIGGEEMLTGSPLTVDEVFAKIDAVTSGDVLAAAQEIFRPSRLNAVLLGPGADSDKFRSIVNSFS